MINRGLSAYGNKRVLLLQGPVGPFFRRFAQDLKAAGATVFKINLNGGDWLFYPRYAINYRGDLAGWGDFLDAKLEELSVDTIMLFGDCRAYHRKAHEIAKKRNLEVGVFEEGYMRPDYVTFEREGVNGNSSLPNDSSFYLDMFPERTVRTDSVGNTYCYAAMWACLYYLTAQLMMPFFWHYKHHRPLTILEAFPWIRSFWRKFFYAIKERGIQDQLTGAQSKKFFMVPLQVHNDSQIKFHSPFETVDLFIRRVVQSFAEKAPNDMVLVFKHHPMDRGYCDYTALTKELRNHYKLGSRLLYIHDQHLPSLLNHAAGIVVVNSTVGLSALLHKAPVMVCGDCIYNITGLVHQGEMEDFWRNAPYTPVNSHLFQNFRSHVIEQTQLNGSFYKKLPIAGSATGMRWEERWLPGDIDRRQRPREIGPVLAANDLHVAAMPTNNPPSTLNEVSLDDRIAEPAQ